MKPSGSRTVWSSEGGDLRKKKGTSTVASLPPAQQTVHLHRDTKGRGGKVVTLLKGLVLSDADLTALAKTLKQACGTGGAVKDGQIEIQGEHRQKIAAILQDMGYRVKIAGG